MKKRKFIALSAVTAAIIASGFFYSPAYAAQAHQGKNPAKYATTLAQRSAIEKAIENNDYATWKTLVKGKIAQLINESNFPKYVEAYNLVKAGKYQEANAIRKELGISNRDSGRLGLGNFKQFKVHKVNKAIKSKLNPLVK